MPKSAYSGVDIYTDTVIRAWVQQQEWESKYSKLTKKKRDAFEALATELNGTTATPTKQIKPPAAKVPAKKRKVKDNSIVVDPRPSKDNASVVDPRAKKNSQAKKRKTVTNGSDSQGEEAKKRKVTGYSVFAKKARERLKKKNIPIDQIDVKEMRKRYAALPPDRKKHYEGRAAEMNE
jgi:hypothetical protein